MSWLRLFALERHLWPVPRLALNMVRRAMLAYRRDWMVIASGFFEPLFYLLSLGVGLGGLVSDVGGVPYAAFVAPGLLASSCLNGAVSDGLFNVWFRLHYQKAYENILATPMRVADIALGELTWASIRGTLYACGFTVVMLALGAWQGTRMLASPLSLLVLPAAVLCSLSFSAMALCLCSFVRRREDFEYVMGLVVMPMFLFSGIFFPASQMPRAVQLLLEAVPLYHGVSLLRACTTADIGVALLWHAAYLVMGGAVAFIVAVRRLERALIF